MKITTTNHLDNVIAFVNNFGPAAVEVQIKYNLPALAVLAQAAQETGWGSNVLRAYVNGVNIQTNNVFNIKAFPGWVGQTGHLENVWEVSNGMNVGVSADFCVFPNIAAAFDGYGQYITTRLDSAGVPVYKTALCVPPACDDEDMTRWVNDYIDGLQLVPYATDPKYASNVKSIASLFRLED